MSCKLDTDGLADAVIVARAINEEVDLLVINKFSNQEASGQDLRDELLMRSSVTCRSSPPSRKMPFRLTDFHRRCRHDAAVRAQSQGGMVARHRWAPATDPRALHRGSGYGYLPTITSDDFIRAERASPTLSPRSSTASW
ncbi:hypothetical protein CQ12_25315 [Bradyrhizobium jicamae]|uniref:Uncharacterized protein n=1 Tax=Bradyrhizobium jicamae TaxID=280332 RepID=A0A0R3LJR1_9BRAD|nr:hypothetical protein CQ12_25315 [Bradyrhizobium jicamae]